MKIIALKLLIVPEENIWDEKRFGNIIKGLSNKIPYYLYKNYELTNDKYLLKHKEPDPPFIDNYIDPLQKKAELQMNVCAIVGKNGSGKSSVIEFIIRLINNLASSVIGDTRVYNSAHPLHFIPDIFAELYYEIDGIFYKISQQGNLFRIYKSGEDRFIYENEHDGKKWRDYFNPNELRETELSRFFYSVVVNYSHYSYNLYDYRPEWSSKELMDIKLALPEEEKERRRNEGEPEILDVERCWLTGIFHKNDGYQTPIVLNPYRYDGNIDIKKEGDLENDRLLSLVLSLDNNNQNILTEIIENKTILSLDIKEHQGHQTVQGAEYKTKKLENFYNQITKAGINFSEVYNQIIIQWSKYYTIDFYHNLHKDGYDNLNELALNYLVYKTLRITWQYNKYAFFYSELIHQKKLLPLLLNDLVKALSEDKSHITLKIRQTICYLICHHFTPSIAQKINVVGERINSALNENWWENGRSFSKETRKNYKQFLGLTPADGGDVFIPSVIDMLPPPFFYVEMNLTDKKKNGGTPFPFNTLSSGEKQMMYTIGTILYHLKNVDSVRERDKTKDIYYEHINIILEEIELYYHPEMQRKLISYIIGSIRKLNLHTKSIQIMLVTHSPFVLSDIPGNNILYLHEGTPYNSHSPESFGANIFELLKDSFYLKDGPVGVHSYMVMEEMFSKLNSKKLSKRNFEAIKNMIPYIGDPFLKDELIKLVRIKES